MIEIDYIFDADAVRDGCQRQDLLSDYTLPEWEMLVRLRVNGIEVFGQTEEEYQRWKRDLESNNVSLPVPSSAWSLLSVLSIAVSADSTFGRLQEEGYGDIDSLDCVIRLARQDDAVTIYIRRDRIGRASYAEMHAAFTAFAERVRRDFLSLCPRLRDHVTLGPWFRGEADSAIVEEPQDIIHLPPAD